MRRKHELATVHITTNVKPELWNQLRELSEISGVPMKDIIAAALEAHMDDAIPAAIAKLEALRKARK